MSISMRYRKGTKLKGSDVARVLIIKCDKCGVSFTYTANKNPEVCPACIKALPKRLRFLPGYHSARIRYYTDK